MDERDFTAAMKRQFKRKSDQRAHDDEYRESGVAWRGHQRPKVVQQPAAPKKCRRYVVTKR